jgi:predicted secreted Zn-dependent protease
VLIFWYYPFHPKKKPPKKKKSKKDWHKGVRTLDQTHGPQIPQHLQNAGGYTQKQRN